MSFYSERRVGELTSRISSDISLLQETLTTTIAEFLRQIIVIIIGIALLAFISLKLTFLMLSLVPVVKLFADFESFLHDNNRKATIAKLQIFFIVCVVINN